MPSEAKKTNSSAKTSDQLVEELLEDLKNRDKKAVKDKDKEKDEKAKKHHKHKKEKKKKHKHRSKSKEKKSRKRSRSPSKERKKDKKRKRRNSSVSTPDRVVTELQQDKDDSLAKKASVRDRSHSPAPSCSSARANDEDDDLPVGADFQTVLDEARKEAENADSSLPPLNLSELPCEPGQSHRKSEDSFPLAKTGKNREKEPAKKKEHEILKKVIETKGPADFVPRNVKVKKDKHAEKPAATESKKDENVVAEKDDAKESSSEKQSQQSEKKSKESKEKQEEVVKNASNKEWEFSIKSLPKVKEKVSKKDKHKGDVKASKSDIGSHRTSLSPQKSKKIKRRSRSKDRKKSRSRSRSKEKRRRSTSRSRSPKSRSRRSRSRSWNRRTLKTRGRRSWSRGRRLSRSWSRGRSRSRTRSRGRSRSRTWSRSRSRERIDKAKLLQIAKKRRAQGIFDIGDENPKSVEDFVSYCEKLQRRQDKEDRQARGEAVSDNDSDIAVPAFKHPYKQISEPIKINIVNAVPLPTKSTEENILDSAALRVVYPVSSGTVHRENTEWTKVQKEAIPLTCSAEQKKFKAMTTLEIEKARQKAKMMGQTAAYFLPPPPAPPALPPPPIPPALPTAFDTLAPPAPPLPATLIIPPEKEMIMKEPEDVTTVPPRNVAEVLARRAKAQRRLQEDPNDFDAMRDLKDANEQMNAWAAVKSIPGKYTGSTGINILTPEELQPHDPRYHAWVKKDMFKQLNPNFTSGIGMKLMSKMGWRPGLGLGRESTGAVEPLMLDVKNDRKGLATEDEMPAKKNKTVTGTDHSGKHPVSLVMELCAKQRWSAPEFTCLESGPSHQREFIWKVVVNGVEYTSATSSRNKKDGKSVACQVVLQSMGIIPNDHHQPVVI